MFSLINGLLICCFILISIFSSSISSSSTSSPEILVIWFADKNELLTLEWKELSPLSYNSKSEIWLKSSFCILSLFLRYEYWVEKEDFEVFDLFDSFLLTNVWRIRWIGPRLTGDWFIDDNKSTSFSELTFLVFCSFSKSIKWAIDIIIFSFVYNLIYILYNIYFLLIITLKNWAFTYEIIDYQL